MEAVIGITDRLLEDELLVTQLINISASRKVGCSG